MWLCARWVSVAPLHQAAPQARISPGGTLSAASHPPVRGLFESLGQFTLLESLALWQAADSEELYLDRAFCLMGFKP